MPVQHTPHGRMPAAVCIRDAARLLLATLVGALAAASALAQTAVFQLQDNTGLPTNPKTYQIYVTGFSTAGPYVLQQDGSWGAPIAPNPAGAVTTLPCYRFPQDITQVQINGQQTAISARVYYFIVTDTVRFPSCNPTTGTGLFNHQGVTNAFTYTQPSLNLTAPTVTDVTSKVFPAWTFSEIGASATSGTIDLSQVDFFSFPMNTTASVTANTPPNPSVIGNPVGTDNPGQAVNYLSIRDSYSTFINALAAAKNGNKSCAVDPTPIECAYLDLLQDISTSPAQTQYVIQNPGGFLGQATLPAAQNSRLNNVFFDVLEALWSSGAPALTIDTGGALGGTATIPTVPQDVFTSTFIPSMNFPGSSFPVRALKFTGTAASGNYVVYTFSPNDYQTGCSTNAIPTQYCSNPPSAGYQVFAGAGALDSPLSDTYAQLLGANLLSPTAGTYGSVGYNAVAGRLGFLISGALNRGVALTPCTGLATWQCWQNETYWYPTVVSATFPSITQNLFAQWMHTATIGGTPMFKRPPGAVNAASSVPGGGKAMGMAYGFSNDENPTPPVTSPPQPEVPSKLDQTVAYGGPGPYTITFGPWVTSLTTPTLAVTTVGQGTVTSSPAGINCGSTCSRAYPAGTTVILTAQPAAGWTFTGWTGACAGSSTTCTVTVTTTTNATAQFTQTSPGNFNLGVVVSGTGSVTSTPAGISCGATCNASFAANTTVTLTASAGAGATFAGWSGACAPSGTSATCVVTMSQAQAVGASFVAVGQFVLTVTGGTGGIVTSTPAAIDCGTRCVAGFAAGTTVNVIARPDPGYQFAGWTGACSGTATCVLTMNTNHAVQASFTPLPQGQFALTVHNYGLGTVVSSPGGINCGNACSASYPGGTVVTLNAVAAPGFQFSGWGGACAGQGACVVTMDFVQYVDATFVPVAVPGGGTPIPTLSQWTLMLLGLLMLAVAGWQGRSPLSRVGRRR